MTRREFAFNAAVGSAVSLLSPTNSLPVEPSVSAQQPANTPELSPEGRVEADARYQTILNIYGARFTDAQKAELRRLCFSAQPGLERIRAYAVTNADNPALYLKPLVEREKKNQVTAAPAASPAKKS